MDALIKRYDAVADGDLMLCHARGVAYQRDMSAPLEYGEAYFDRYVALEGQPIACAINAGRVALVDKYVGRAFPVLDVGIGSGEFIRSRPNTLGMDVNPKAQAWLARAGKLADGIGGHGAYTFWDVLEHVPVPNRYFKRMPDGCFVFCCLPIFDDLNRIRDSKHYKPNEHLYYFTEAGFVDWMARYRFRLLERSEHETAAGRESITSFSFVRDLPGYLPTIDQYRQIYGPNYGDTAYLYFDLIAKEVLALNPASILDYGCGRSDLAAHFWHDGRRRIAKHDPAIPRFEPMPEGTFDLALCTDVMEHINLGDVDRVLEQIRGKARHALFTISLRPARAHLPDGRNAHVTLLNAGEWTRWIADVFGRAERVPTAWDHLLMLKTF